MALQVAGASGQGSTDAVAGDTVLKTNTGRLLLQTGSGASAIAINSNDVGIGTASPITSLEIGPTNVNTTTHYQLSLGAYDSTRSNLPQITLGNNGSNYNAIGYDAAGGALVFGTANTLYSSSFAAENLVISQSGNVGIGTTNPGYQLDVFATDTTPYSPTTADAALRLYNPSATDSAFFTNELAGLNAMSQYGAIDTAR